ncbi:invasion-like protein [Chelatococcus sp. CO-6]|nr:invasion-like protein [Chelatococcus sp. CO-6]
MMFAAVSTGFAGAAAQEAALPGGATSLREAHGDWLVTCAVKTGGGKKTRVCALSQEQFHAQTRQRVLAVELRPAGGGARGTLVLPFGLLLDKGAAYQLDEGPAGPQQRFRTCLPAGCLIEVDFDAATVKALRGGKALRVKATTDGGEETNLSLSLAGFAGAYDRTVILLK